MARGYPDFFGTSVFPMYGNNGIVVNGPATVGPGITRTIFDEGGKFVLQGGYLDMMDDDSIGASQVLLYLDGVMVFGQTLSNMIDYQGKGAFHFPWYLLCYSPSKERYIIGFYGPYTVGTGWRLDLTSASTVNIRIYGRVWVSTIV